MVFGKGVLELSIIGNITCLLCIYTGIWCNKHCRFSTNNYLGFFTNSGTFLILVYSLIWDYPVHVLFSLIMGVVYRLPSEVSDIL